MDLEDAVMAAGYRSCFGCVNHGRGEICAGCNFPNRLWEPNERWKKAQKKEERHES